MNAVTTVVEVTRTYYEPGWVGWLRWATGYAGGIAAGWLIWGRR